MSQLMISDSPNRFKAFVACPITTFCGPSRAMPPAFRAFIESIYDVAVAECDEVFLALKRERWGQAIMPAEICTPLDLTEMKRCDLVIAFPGASCGVAVELGWASALRKSMILILEEGMSYSPVVLGLESIAGLSLECLRVPPMNEEWNSGDLPRRLRDAVIRVRRRWLPSTPCLPGKEFRDHGYA
jgi:hypothetical protein